MGKKQNLEVNFKIVRVPLPPSMVEARRASLLMLLEWFEEERHKNESTDGNGQKWEQEVTGGENQTHPKG